MENYTLIIILVGIMCGIAGFGLSELLLVVKISSRVSVTENEIKNLKGERTETNELLSSIVDQNTKVLAQLVAHIGMEGA